eukprot:5151971-Amphidinium_carterae.1
MNQHPPPHGKKRRETLVDNAMGIPGKTTIDNKRSIQYSFATMFCNAWTSAALQGVMLQVSVEEPLDA